MNERSATTRDALLEATRTCVRRHGLAGTTSRQITAEAGANLAAITYHFGSKDQLVADALFGEIERRVRPALDAFDRPGPPADTMLAVVQGLLSEFEKSKDDAAVYLEAILVATRDPAYRARAVDVYAGIGRRLAAVVSDLIDADVIPAWVDPAAMSSLILAVANGIAVQTQLDPDGSDHVAMASQFASLLLAAAAT